MAKKPFNKSKNQIVEPRINNEIVGYESIRLIYNSPDGDNDKNFNKVVSLREAKNLSYQYRLDLIEVNAKAVPPIILLADYSKYLWDLKKRLKSKPKNVSVLKEVQLSTNISLHDLEVKANRAKSFIEEGNKVKVVLTMRGRELTRREQSKESFRQFIDMLSEVATYDSYPKDEGNRTIAILRKK
jgi:translation initiation factor IF-3